MPSKRLHVLGGGVWQIPTIQLAKALGHTVLVTDMYDERPGYALADRHETIDIRDLAATLDAARRFGAQGVLCDTTDAGVPTAAYVAEQLGLRGIGYRTAVRFTNKFAMRNAAAGAGIVNPRYAVARSLDQARRAMGAVGFPMAVKPADSQSSRGVTKVRSESGIAAAFAHAASHSQSGEVLLEEWVSGIEITVEGMAYEGIPYALAISGKDHYDALPQVASRLVYPPGFDEDLLAAIENTNAAVVRALGLRTGITHAEYIVTSAREIYLVEIAARGGGSRLYTHIAPHVSGVDLPRLYLDWILGGSEPWPAPQAHRRAAVLEFFDFAPGRVASIAGLDRARAVPGVAEVAVELQIGQDFAGASDDRSRPGYVVALADSRDDALAAAAAARNEVRVVTR